MAADGIQTPRLKLVPATLQEARLAVDAMPPADRVHLSADWLARLDALTEVDRWTLGFTIFLRDHAQPIGKSGFKGPPSPDRAVEIAYCIQPEHHNRGYATEAANALFAFAFQCQEVQVVRAHTLPQPNASTRVLAKCGFVHRGEVIDPEDGPVWRWEGTVDRP